MRNLHKKVGDHFSSDVPAIYGHFSQLTDRSEKASATWKTRTVQRPLNFLEWISSGLSQQD